VQRKHHAGWCVGLGVRNPTTLAAWCLRALVLAALLLVGVPGTPARAGELAITMDDFNLRETTRIPAAERNQRILAALAKHRSHGALFVRAQYIESAADRELLAAWGRAGHLIGNHTFAHRAYARQTFEDASQDILRAHDVLSGVPGFAKLFRFPFLGEGDTVEKRDRMRRWLAEQGYRVGSVTIDASDWYYDQRLRERLAREPGFDPARYREPYLEHMWERTGYYDGLARRVLGRELKHTLLVHFNLVNALFLDDLLAMYERRGWTIIDAAKAFEDPVFARLPDSMPSGQSIVWGLAKESGKFERELRYPGEDGPAEKAKLDALGL